MRVRSERGFTLVELLVVLLILGGLSSIAVLAITRFLGSGTAEAANTEVHQAQCCHLLLHAGGRRESTGCWRRLWTGTAVRMW